MPPIRRAGDRRRRRPRHEPCRLPRTGGIRGRPRLPHRRAGRGARGRAGERALPARRRAARRCPRRQRRRARARRPRPRLPGSSRPRAARRSRRPRRADPAPRRPARALQGARAAARHAALGLRRRALQRPRRRRARRAGRTPPRCSSTAPRWSLASLDRAFARQLADALARAPARRGDHARRHRRRARRLRQERRGARGRARPPAPGPNVAGAAAGKVFAEVDALARLRGGSPRRSPGWPAPATWSRPSSPTGSRNRRPASCSPRACPPRRSAERSASAEAVDSVPLLAELAREAQLETPALESLAALRRGPDRARALDGGRDRAGAGAGAAPCPRGVSEGRLPMRWSSDVPTTQGGARRSVHRAVPSAPARRLLLQLLPRRQPPRRRGPHRADVPAGLPPLRARAARVQRPAAAAVAHPHRAQPGGELLPRPLAQAGVGDRGRRA